MYWQYFILALKKEIYGYLILVEYRMVKSAAIESAMAKGAYQDWSFPPRAEAYQVGQIADGKRRIYSPMLKSSRENIYNNRVRHKGHYGTNCCTGWDIKSF
jgi:hypothetical protein